MACVPAMKSVAYDTYSVSGKTLPAIAKSLRCKGPKDPHGNKNMAFLTTTELECLTAKGKYAADGGSEGALLDTSIG
ncbi:hypothetical protein METH_02880 [Leisingera methylohalidivorans DSM 14336]|uniref:Uncharacterized protein n=1 Tax=Leisingera methylohalidivorans DSM 14336 TaxID=999552 RepID=V9VZQ3_9RHOB|nr:hypothetical protein METH_02880 [Leisingera methylohalidivorans DSM 14336]